MTKDLSRPRQQCEGKRDLTRRVALQQMGSGGVAAFAVVPLILPITAQPQVGFSLIKHKRAEAGTYARTVVQMEAAGMSVPGLSVMHWIPPDFDEAIRKGSLRTEDLSSAIQTALRNLPEGGAMNFPEGATLTVGATVDATFLPRNVRLWGGSLIKATPDRDFLYLLDLTGCVAPRVEGLRFDANKEARAKTVRGKLSCLKLNSTAGARLVECQFRGALGMMEWDAGLKMSVPRSSVAVSASAVQNLLVQGCKVLECGHSANDRPSDGFFIRGDDCHVVGTTYKDITDHVIALEGCNRSGADGVSGTGATSIVGLSNDTSADVRGNYAKNIRGTVRHFGSGGGVVGIYTFGAGAIIDTQWENIHIIAENDATGAGPAFAVSGKVARAQATRLNCDPAESDSGVMSHGLLVDVAATSDSFQLRNSILKVGRSGACVRIRNASSGVCIDANTLTGGHYAIYASENALCSESENTISGQTVSAVGVEGSAIIRKTDCRGARNP